MKEVLLWLYACNYTAYSIIFFPRMRGVRGAQRPRQEQRSFSNKSCRMCSWSVREPSADHQDEPRGSPEPTKSLQDELRGSPEATKSLLETSKTSQEAAWRQPRAIWRPPKRGTRQPGNSQEALQDRSVLKLAFRARKASYTIPKWAPILGQNH